MPGVAHLTREEAGARHRMHVQRRQRQMLDAASNIAPVPKRTKRSRWQRCKRDLHKFLKTYFPATTGLSPFSDSHKVMIANIQNCVLHGGRFLQAVPRGIGKTTISQNAALWAIVYGHRRFVIIVGADATASHAHIESIRKELEENDLLYEDFPEICHAARALEGKAQRCKSQHVNGQRTHIEWKQERLVMPSLKKSPSSGGVIVCKGITAGIRGLVHKRVHDAVNQRPDFVIIDDPQTNESAKSNQQINTRIDIISRDILKLAGHTTSIACVINATVIEQDDLVDQMLDHEKHSAWQTARIPFVVHWPNRHEDLWQKEYAELRTNFDPTIPGDRNVAIEAANKFYLENREEMDAGSEVIWDYAYNRDVEHSALQHAENILIDDGEEVFQAELQNQPQLKMETYNYLNAREIAAKITSYEKYVVPQTCHKLTAMIDLGARAHWYTVAAWQDNFTGFVLDYGPYPKQERAYPTVDNLVDSFDRRWPGESLEQQIRKGLSLLVDELLGQVYVREDGVEIMIERLLIDANWGLSTDMTYAYIRESPHRSILLPSHGKYVGASSQPMTYRKERQAKRGEYLGLNWYLPAVERSGIRHLVFDANYWKSFVHSRLATSPGDAGSLSLYNAGPNVHRVMGDHCTAEYPVRTFGRGREVDEWKYRSRRPDNHLFDCMVGVCIAASMQGCNLIGEEHSDKRTTQRKKVSLLAR